MDQMNRRLQRSNWTLRPAERQSTSGHYRHAKQRLQRQHENSELKGQKNGMDETGLVVGDWKSALPQQQNMNESEMEETQPQ
jgi:hypothetical protein